MDILYLLIPVSVVIVFLIIAVFAWAMRGGQFEDVEREGLRILDDDAKDLSGALGRTVDADQARHNRGLE